MKQHELFGRGAPYQRHSPTSRAAASSIDGELNRLQLRVLSFLQNTPSGATDEQIQDALEMNPSTERPRRVELHRKGWILPDGERKTRSGRRAVVWKITNRETPCSASGN